MATERKSMRDLGRDEGAAWAVACLVKSYGIGTEAMELAEAWGMHRLMAVADDTDLPWLNKLIKDYPGRFQEYRSLRRSEARKKGKPRSQSQA